MAEKNQFIYKFSKISKIFISTILQYLKIFPTILPFKTIFFAILVYEIQIYY